MKRRSTLLCFVLSVLGSLWFLSVANAMEQQALQLRTLGSLFFGGSVSKAQDGETFHGDHGYAQYYIPINARTYPIILWHGLGQSGRSWETTPDGREGYQALLPRLNWATYIIDQPRRGRAGYTLAKPEQAGIHPTTSRESSAWNAFRNGVWVPPQPPMLFQNVLFPSDPASIEQFFRQQTPNTGIEPYSDEHRRFMAKTIAALFARTGPAILVTHSNSGQYGWFTGMHSQDKVKAIVAYEPGQIVLPKDTKGLELPIGNEQANQAVKAIRVAESDFMKLTKMPILVIYGDNISQTPSAVFNVEVWRLAKAWARLFVEEVNARGGDATLIVLPEQGIKGNTHAPFADLNNREIVTQLDAWLSAKNLAQSDKPHTGPAPALAPAITLPLLR